MANAEGDGVNPEPDPAKVDVKTDPSLKGKENAIDPKKNTNFVKLQNAIKKAGEEFKADFVSEKTRLELGKQRYGGKKEAK